ncbi:MAG: hypothetical protein P4L26_12600 [Terracidiphilus sp.]|nr:hypothetical protein [Terracidiphilus sp.]
MTPPIEAARFEALKELAKEHFGPINAAEKEVLRISTSGDGPPSQGLKTRPEVDAKFLRWLATDKDAAAHIDPFGLRIWNATITSAIRLEFCNVPFPLTFAYCTLKEQFCLKWANLKTLYLLQCTAEQGISAEGLTTQGHVFLSNLQAGGRIHLLEAQVGGSLECSGAQLTAKHSAHPSGCPMGECFALLADRAKIASGVNLQKLNTNGSISFSGAQIGGELDCADAILAGPECSLRLDEAKVTDDVLLNGKFTASGSINLNAAQIGGDLDCSGATLTAKGDAINADRAKITGNALFRARFSSSGRIVFLNAQINGELDCSGATIRALECVGTQINGSWIWVGIRRPELGDLDLSRSSFGRLHDDQASWPSKGNLHLDGLVYQELVLHEPSTPEMIADNWFAPSLKLTAEDRIRWLIKQPDAELNKPEPWMQVAKMLEASGDPDGAKRVIYEFRRQQARVANPHFYLLILPYYQLEEQPLWILLPIALLWLFGFVIFWRARRMNAMCPKEEDAYNDFKESRMLPSQYAPFNAAMYALENVLPVVKLGQDDAWEPNPQAKPASWFPHRPRLTWTRWLPGMNYPWLAMLRWILILLGWALALILAAAISERFKT